jgi:hypothetical protein
MINPPAAIFASQFYFIYLYIVAVYQIIEKYFITKRVTF